MNRKSWDQIVSGAGGVVAIVLVVIGILAVYGGSFGRDNVKDRLEPQNITFPPAAVMSDEEKAIVGDLAGEKVDTGTEAEVFSQYIGLHLEEVNEGKTYSETSAMAREEGLDPEQAAELQGMADTLFKGESLRAILLNAYGWWTVATLALFAGYGLIAAGLVLAILATLGFRHARKVAETAPKTSAVPAQ